MQLELFDPAEPRILPQTPGAFFTINRMVGGRMRQSVYPLRRLAELVPACAGSTDTYMSQAVFATPRRRVVDVAHITHGLVDLDTYRDPDLAPLSPPALTRILLDHCHDAGIPPPSIILSSGRGLYGKWFWSAPLPRAEAGRATAVNRMLVRQLSRFRADPAAVDMARVLRVRGTINSKNDRPVEIVHLAGTQDAPLTYTFDTFARTILPAPIEAVPVARAPRQVQPARPGRFTREGWHWTILEDLRTLVARRYPSGVVTKGMRDLFGHLAACQLARVVPASVLDREIRAVASGFLPAGYVDGELKQSLATLMNRVAGGELVPFNGRSQTPIYSYSKGRLMQLLQVTPDEEREMAALISDAEKRRRHIEAEKVRRRAAGVVDREAYEATAAMRRGRVVELRGRGMTWRAIGTELGISEGEARRVGSAPLYYTLPA